MKSSKEECSLRRGELVVLAVMLVINVAMTVYFLLKTGFKSYVGIFLFMSFGWLLGCYLGFKQGYILGQNHIIRREDGPWRFYLHIAVLIVLYFLMLLVFVGLYFQELAKLG